MVPESDREMGVIQWAPYSHGLKIFHRGSLGENHTVARLGRSYCHPIFFVGVGGPPLWEDAVGSYP